MLTDPIQNGGHLRQFKPLGEYRSVYHQNWQLKRSGRRNLGVSCCPTRVFRNYQVDPLRSQQGQIVGFLKRSTIDNDFGVGKRQIAFRWVHKTQNIVMLGVRGEVRKMHPAYGQEDADGLLVQSVDGGWNIWNSLPVIPRSLLPRWAGECGKRNARRLASLYRVAAHLRCKRVRRIDDMRHLVFGQVTAQPVRASESANALRKRLTDGAVDPACQRHRGTPADFRDSLCQRGGFRRSTQNKEVRRHV